MKRILVLILSIILISGLGACNKTDNGEPPVEEVSIKYYSDASELLPALKQNVVSIGLLPEPAATKLTTMGANYSFKLNVQTLYGGNYPQAVIVAKKSVVENDGKFIKSLIQSLADNEWVKNNTDSAVDAINNNLVELENSSLDKTSLNKTVVENCNIYFEKATESKTVVTKYISDLIAVESSSAKVLSDNFYYNENETLTENSTGKYSIVAPDGAPALSLAKLMNENNQLNREVDYKIVSSTKIMNYVKNTDETKLGDVVVLPINAASKLIGNGDVYEMLGVVTHGNLFIMSNQEINSINDLKGKTIGVIGQGLVPDLTLRAIFKSKSISYKQI